MANNKGADQAARMRRLICAFVVRMRKIKFFSRWKPIFIDFVNKRQPRLKIEEEKIRSLKAVSEETT